ncbi:hypothetical protein EJ110_NYTH03203 [Nymphaea thermarum]|nr:hypothetical protein EJ110_NYTH03203 [Nymphaea thermarum]
MYYMRWSTKNPLTLEQPTPTLTNFPKDLFSSRLQKVGSRASIVAFAGRSKKKPGGPSSGRIEGNAEVRREAKRNARKRSRRIADNFFFRKNDPDKNYADEFTEEELETIGLGYDRKVRFMKQDDPALRHPYDWYKYGEYGPYSWRGVVVGDPIRGRFSDERVSIISSVKDHEEWEQIEQFDMVNDYGKRLSQLDESIGLKHFWVFVRHPKWKLSELPWKEWTLVSEVALETGETRLDKWNLMGRLGNKTRALITQCAAWMRPDIVYVKRPVYQCRFEPQDMFFQALVPLLDPATEGNSMFEVKLEDGRSEMLTYFGGLCKIVRVNPKAYVDDVVKAYEKLDDEKKSVCWEFLLANHPVPLLHPWTKEWKAKLEEMELGCDAKDEDEAIEITYFDWIEEDDGEEGDDDDDSPVIDEDEGEDDEYEELGIKQESVTEEETEKYWEEEFEKAIKDSQAMESLVKKSMEVKSEFYKRQMEWINDNSKLEKQNAVEQKEIATAKTLEAKKSVPEWEHEGYGRRKVKKSKIPPELFLRAAVRPFTYKNLLKEIVLMRHAIIDQEVSVK